METVVYINEKFFNLDDAFQCFEDNFRYFRSLGDHVFIKEAKINFLHEHFTVSFIIERRQLEMNI